MVEAQLPLFDEDLPTLPLYPCPSDLPAHDVYTWKQRRELYRQLGRLIDRFNHPGPRVKRRRRLMSIEEILE